MRREVYSLGSKSVVVPSPAHIAPDGRAQRAKGRVIVVGGAVMDATFRTKVLPERDTSSEAYDFVLSPGGKGLTQAIAAARLGLDVSLLAAVADDRFGLEIIEYLQREGVDTSMLKVVNDARTPFTGIIEFELGDSVAVNWRNEREVRLDIRDVERFESQLLASDAMLVTFELPRESMQRTLSLVQGAQGRRPLKIVTPGQPYTDGNVSGQALAQIDYLVAHAWELGRYAPPDQSTFDLDAVARRVLAYGVETLCIPIGGGLHHLLGNATGHVYCAHLSFDLQGVISRARCLLRGAGRQADRWAVRILGTRGPVGHGRDGGGDSGPSDAQLDA
jgi:ribokinase